MGYKVGDVLVFIGNNTSDNHYNNFEVGKKYTVKSVGFLYDSDQYSVDSSYVTFEENTHGSLVYKIKRHFVSLDDYRNIKINQVL